MTTRDLPYLVDRWPEGFARSRQVAYARYGDLVEVEVDEGGRRLELVLTEPGSDLLTKTAARVVGTADVWPTAFSAAPWITRCRRERGSCSTRRCSCLGGSSPATP